MWKGTRDLKAGRDAGRTGRETWVWMGRGAEVERQGGI